MVTGNPDVVKRAIAADTNYFIPYGKQYVSKEDVLEVSKVLSSPYLTTGPVAAQFEKALCELTGAKHAIVCANGTAALHLACLALDLKKGDCGVTTPNTFLASANCIEFCGGTADFVDIDSQTLCISPSALEEYCKNVAIPKVVVAVDYAGVSADMVALFALSKKFGFKLIQDSAHSIGSTYTYNGTQVACGSCTHSDMAIFSFHPVKSITSGEGGAVLTNSDELAKRVRMLYSHGMVRAQDLLGGGDGPWYYEMQEISYNFRITDFQCALGASQLKKLDAIKKRRFEICTMYSEAFKGNTKIILPPQHNNKDLCRHLYPIQFSEGKEARSRIYAKLKEAKILCQIHYIPVYWQPYYANKYGYAKGKAPEAELFYSRCLSLPLFPTLTNDEVAYVIEQLLSIV